MYILRLLFIMIVLLTSFYSCSKEKKLTKYTVRYSQPYYAVVLNPTLIFDKPNPNENIAYKLKADRIVKLNASISLQDKNDIWYLLSESDFEGYAKPDNFKLFEDLVSADSFIKSRFPRKESIKASLSLYNLAYEDYKQSDFKNANIKLHRVLSMNEDLVNNKASLYYTTLMLIGNIYIKEKEYQKALVHFQSVSVEEKNNYIKLISQKDFNPEGITFSIKGIMQDINEEKSNIQKNANLDWEILCYTAFIYQKKRRYKKAMEIYSKLIKEKKISGVELPYINFIIDQISKIKNINYLKVLKVNKNTSHRYLLYKLASLLEKTEKIKAIKYYKDFVRLFEQKYYKNPYPNETIHYIKAKEAVKKALKGKKK